MQQTATAFRKRNFVVNKRFALILIIVAFAAAALLSSVQTVMADTPACDDAGVSCPAAHTCAYIGCDPDCYGKCEPDASGCGNHVVAGSEDCEGSDISSATCTTNANCGGSKSRSCLPSSCTWGDWSGCSGGTACVTCETCALSDDGSGYYCAKTINCCGNGACERGAGEKNSNCAADCPVTCGDGVIEGTEACDGNSLKSDCWTDSNCGGTKSASCKADCSGWGAFGSCSEGNICGVCAHCDPGVGCAADSPPCCGNKVVEGGEDCDGGSQSGLCWEISNCGGTKSRSCTASCTWGDWGGCSEGNVCQRNAASCQICDAGTGCASDPNDCGNNGDTTILGCSIGYRKVCDGCQLGSCQLIPGCDDDGDSLIDSSCGGTDCNDAQERIGTCSEPKPYCYDVPIPPSPNCVQCRTSADCSSGYYCSSNSCVQKSCTNNPPGCDSDILTNDLKCGEGQSAHCKEECQQRAAWPYGLNYDSSTGKCVECAIDTECPALCMGDGLSADFYCNSAKNCSSTVNKVPAEEGFYCEGNFGTGCCWSLPGPPVGGCIDYDNNTDTGYPLGPVIAGDGYSCIDREEHAVSFVMVNEKGQETTSFMAIGKPYKFKIRIEDKTGDFYNPDTLVVVTILDAGGVYRFGGDLTKVMSLIDGQCACASTWQGKCTAANCLSTFNVTPSASWATPVTVQALVYDATDS